MVPAVVEHDAAEAADDIARVDDREAAGLLEQGNQALLREPELVQRSRNVPYSSWG